MAPYKNQHFVPKMILRNFSRDGSTVGAFVLNSRQLIPRAPISGQCSETYFYGKDLQFEKAFSLDEGPMEALIRTSVLAEEGVVSDETVFALKQFVHFQRNRTRRALDTAAAFDDANMKLELQSRGLVNGVDLSSITIKRKGGASAQVSEAVLSLGTLVDLDLCLLISADGRFVISDHPVVAYNDFVEHVRSLRDLPGAIGLVAKGLQYFMPVSPNVTLALYDPTTYAYGNGDLRVTVKPADVDLLNGMQAVNADNCVYFPEGVERSELERLADVRKKRSLGIAPVSQVGNVRHEGEFTKGTTALSLPVMRMGRRLSFVRVTETFDYERYRAPFVPTRNFELPRFAIDFARHLVHRQAERDGTTVNPEFEELFSSMEAEILESQ